MSVDFPSPRRAPRVGLAALAAQTLLTAPLTVATGSLTGTATGRDNTDADFLHGKGAFQYLSYHDVFRFYSALAKTYPNYIKIWSADELFPHLRDFDDETDSAAKQAFLAKMAENTCGSTPVEIHGRKTPPQPNAAGEYPCESLLVQVANFAKLTEQTPEVLAVGEVHGNEKVGVSIVSETVRQLVQSKDTGTETSSSTNAGQHQQNNIALGKKELGWLLDNRSIWVMPLPNAYGYYHDVREDQNVDPNRDMPYLNKNCMQSFAGRFLNELARTHLFRQMIEFHAGTRQLVYEWAGPNHVMVDGATPGSVPEHVIQTQDRSDGNDGVMSSETPDATAYKVIARFLQLAAGEGESAYWYPQTGPHTDMIYWIRGGIQDWLYAATFEQPGNAQNGEVDAKHPIAVHCPGYPDAKLDYRKHVNLRALSWLVETDDNKHVPEAEFGSIAEFFDNRDKHGGQLPRNMRLTLKMFEMADPGIRFGDEGLYGVGCEKIDSARLLNVCGPSAGDSGTIAHVHPAGGDDVFPLVTDSGQTMGGTPCSGLNVWLPGEEERHLFHDAAKNSVVPYSSFPVKFQNLVKTKPQCVVVEATFDKGWAAQGHLPDPDLHGPQSHSVLARIQNSYEAQSPEGGFPKISATRERLFGADGKVWYSKNQFEKDLLAASGKAGAGMVLMGKAEGGDGAQMVGGKVLSSSSSSDTLKNTPASPIASAPAVPSPKDAGLNGPRGKWWWNLFSCTLLLVGGLFVWLRVRSPPQLLPPQMQERRDLAAGVRAAKKRAGMGDSYGGEDYGAIGSVPGSPVEGYRKG